VGGSIAQGSEEMELVADRKYRLYSKCMSSFPCFTSSKTHVLNFMHAFSP
jgi:hypothetical protein